MAGLLIWWLILVSCGQVVLTECPFAVIWYNWCAYTQTTIGFYAFRDVVMSNKPVIKCAKISTELFWGAQDPWKDHFHIKPKQRLHCCAAIRSHKKHFFLSLKFTWRIETDKIQHVCSQCSAINVRTQTIRFTSSAVLNMYCVLRTVLCKCIVNVFVYVCRWRFL